MKTSAISESTRQRESIPVLESTPTLELFRVEESTLLESTPHPYDFVIDLAILQKYYVLPLVS